MSASSSKSSSTPKTLPPNPACRKRYMTEDRGTAFGSFLEFPEDSCGAGRKHPVQIILRPHLHPVKPKHLHVGLLLHDYLCENQVTVLIWAASALCVVSAARGLEYRIPGEIRKVFFSGEVMPCHHLRRNIPKTTLFRPHRFPLSLQPPQSFGFSHPTEKPHDWKTVFQWESG